MGVALGVEQRARLLTDLASALTAAATDLDRVLDCAAHATAAIIGDGALIRLVNDDDVFDRAAVHHPDATLTEALRALLPVLGQRADEGFAGAVRRSGEPAIRNDISAEQFRSIAGPAIWPHLARLDVGAILMVPLFVDDTYLGNLSASRSGRNRPYSEQDAALAADIAARVSLAVQTAQVVNTLRVERENYRRIVQTSLEGIWEVDLDGVTTFANDRMAAILATTVTDLLHLPASDWLVETDREEHQRRLAQRRDDRAEVYEVRLRRADGDLVWTQVAAAPMHDQAGVVTGSLAMVTDISDRVRSRDLQDRIEQMQRLDSLGQLVGGIAHDFNNVLTIIGGAADLIRTEAPTDSPLAPLVDQVVTAVEHGATLTRQLLTFGRGQPGQAEIVDLMHVVGELAPMLRRTLGSRLHLDAPPTRDDGRPCLVRVDHGQLQQVIVNLAANARDAMPDGGTLSIECEHTLLDRAELGAPTNTQHGPHDETNDDTKAWFVRLAVSDTGPGMDAETLRRAFEPFYTTKPAHQGTGLGLANVYGIVRAAGGVVRLYSEPGHGLTVKIYLPAYDEQSDDQQESATAAAPGPTSTHGTRILVVEDNPELAELLYRLLQRAGYQVDVTGDPIDALARLDTGLHIDLLLTDVVMPDLTGPELAAQIRTRRPDLPVIYTSGYTAALLTARADVPGDAVILEKPFTRTTLLAAVSRALNTLSAESPIR